MKVVKIKIKRYKNNFIKRKLKFENYKNYLESSQHENKIKNLGKNIMDIDNIKTY